MTLESFKGSQLGAGCLLPIPGHRGEGSLGRCPAQCGGQSVRESHVCVQGPRGVVGRLLASETASYQSLPPSPATVEGGHNVTSQPETFPGLAPCGVTLASCCSLLPVFPLVNGGVDALPVWLFPLPEVSLLTQAGLLPLLWLRPAGLPSGTDLCPLYPGYGGTPGQVPASRCLSQAEVFAFCFLPPAHLLLQALPWCQAGVSESLGLSTPLTKLQFLSCLAPVPQLPDVFQMPSFHSLILHSLLAQTPVPLLAPYPSLTSYPQHSSCSPLSQFLSGSVPTSSSPNSLCLA